MSFQDIYHEKQSMHKCGLHSLNNLLGSCIFKTSDLDQICKELSPSSWFFNNPHKTWWGDYDANVLCSALIKKGKDTHWVHKNSADKYNGTIKYKTKNTDSLTDTTSEKKNDIHDDKTIGSNNTNTTETYKTPNHDLNDDPFHISLSTLDKSCECGCGHTYQDISDLLHEYSFVPSLKYLLDIQWNLVEGVILNVEGGGGTFGSDRHWLAIRRNPTRAQVTMDKEIEGINDINNIKDHLIPVVSNQHYNNHMETEYNVDGKVESTQKGLTINPEEDANDENYDDFSDPPALISLPPPPSSFSPTHKLTTHPWLNLDSRISSPQPLLCLCMTLFKLWQRQPDATILLVTKMGAKHIVPDRE